MEPIEEVVYLTGVTPQEDAMNAKNWICIVIIVVAVVACSTVQAGGRRSLEERVEALEKQVAAMTRLLQDEHERAQGRERELRERLNDLRRLGD